ncbi:unnamed protein product [Mytilus coruscus]|uniref:Reverse transcriptase/retrotransposon-derived protein RNase H-like domain-containing protein n=1 Tax=Mytilus coruscus TaxID=42192 RepID=A0A6J8D4B9_MYTCO|nr:unnamed protein product [Mytilus coruscus]
MRHKQVLDRSRDYNLKLSAGKYEISKPEVTYVGHRLTSEGVKLDPEKIRAVNKMSKPECVKDLQTFMGFIQYLDKFMPNMSIVSAPLRTLLEKITMLKEMATNAPLLQYYDLNKPLTLSVDASSKGLGAVLIQNQKPVGYASRALTQTQKRYPQIEKETLAIVYGCNKFYEYLITNWDIFDGWPNEKSELLHSLIPYWTFRDELSVIGGLLYKSNKAIVPKALQNEMLDKIHESHLGIVKCKSRARDVLFWIGMGQDIEDKVKACGLCAQH